MKISTISSKSELNRFASPTFAQEGLIEIAEIQEKVPVPMPERQTGELETKIMKKNVTNDSVAKKQKHNKFKDGIYELTKAHPRNEEEILELRS
ncbi:MAG TPA: hypothetical protein VF648_13710 [Pyrinomonadaceae bacterium]